MINTFSSGEAIHAQLKATGDQGHEEKTRILCRSSRKPNLNDPQAIVFQCVLRQQQNGRYGFKRGPVSLFTILFIQMHGRSTPLMVLPAAEPIMFG